MNPTVVLVHGAFADSSSWNDVAMTLTGGGLSVIAYANPLRGVSKDAAGLTDLVRGIYGPILLVGHSYGGAVITNVGAAAGEIVGLVYVAAFALDAGESEADAAGSVPGSSLGDALRAVPLSRGGKDLYITPEKYHHQFCADLPEQRAALMAMTQGPITEGALGEASRPAPYGRPHRAGSSSATRTSTFPSRLTATWLNAPTPCALSRSPAPQMSSDRHSRSRLPSSSSRPAAGRHEHHRVTTTPASPLPAIDQLAPAG